MKIGKYITLKQEIVNSSTTGVDDITITQRYQVRPLESVIVSENARFCEIKGVRTKHTFDFTVTFSDEVNTIKFYQPNDTVSEVADMANVLVNAIKNKSAVSAVETLILPIIYDSNGNEIGKFESYIVDNGSSRKNYSTIKCTYNNKEYILYETPSHIRQNAAFVVYENNEKIVAEILVDQHKGLSSNRDLMKYDIYVEDDSYFKLACLLTVVWKGMTGDEEKQYAINRMKENREKYSEEYVENIRKNINPSYLPENMALVDELYKSGKYEIKRYFPRILVYVALLFLAVIVLMVFLTGGFSK